MMGFLRQHRSKPARIVDALDKALAIIEFDVQGNILAANDVFCNVMGYRAAEVVGKHHRIFVDPAYANSEDYRSFWLKLGRGEFDRQEYLRIGNHGKQVWIQASYNPILDARGRVKSIVKVATETSAAHLKNADFEAKLAAISRVQGIIEFNPDGEVIDANENFLALLGYELAEIKGQHHRLFVDGVYAQSVAYREHWQKLNAGEFVSGEFQRFGKSGEPVWIQASYNPIFDLDGKVTSIVKFATDVTGRVRAVAEVADGLTELAANNLVHRLSRPFDPTFERLRADYNASLDGLQATMSRVVAGAKTMSLGNQDIAASTDGLSRRIEQQAASLEETAAALDQITATVKQSAEGAFQAAVAASGARTGTAVSGKVVREMAAVMSEISDSSKKITMIISVMDEIAFQTNLLALNAGVEAARAGDSGKGFAVVAQEVRALAQRSAAAAREINALIASSSEEVVRGVKLVSETVSALDGVTDKVDQIDALLSAMAVGAREQATGLGEVNIAVNHMDQMTQQNASMIEQATYAASRLKAEAAELASLMAQFRIGQEEQTHAERRAPQLRTAASRR